MAMTFGQIIKAARQAKGIRTQDFAKLAGISPNYLSKIEMGDRFPKRDKLDKICQLLQIENAPQHNYDRHQIILLLSEKMATDYELFNALGLVAKGEITAAQIMEGLC